MLLIAQEGLHIYQFSHPETVANQCSLCLHIYCLSLQVNNNCTDMIKYSPILKGFSRLWDLFACCVSEVKIGAWPEDQGKRYAKTHQTTLILTYLTAVLLNLQLSRTGLALTLQSCCFKKQRITDKRYFWWCEWLLVIPCVNSAHRLSKTTRNDRSLQCRATVALRSSSETEELPIILIIPLDGNDWRRSPSNGTQKEAI